MSVSNKSVFYLLFSVLIAMPNGVAKYLVPTILVSSPYEYPEVRVPVVSLQFIFLFIFFFIFAARWGVSRRCLNPLISVFIFSTFFSFFSVSPAGFFSYTSVWLASALFLVYSARIFGGKLNVPEFLLRIAVYFFPFYLLDFALSVWVGSVSGFSSILFASNGHSFVSYLMVLMILIGWLNGCVGRGSARLFVVLILFCYFLGGVFSEGRMALAAFLISSAVIFFGRKGVPYFVLLGLLGLGSYFVSDRVSDAVSLIRDLDIDDRVAWSSMYSRVAFWEVFMKIFHDNLIAGGGGLYINFLKFNYGFPFDVFVDPHNEMVYLLSGFGLAGVLMVVSYFILASRVFSADTLGVKLPTKRQAVGGLLYVAMSSLTNANTAKLNIAVLVIVVSGLLLASLFARRYE